MEILLVDDDGFSLSVLKHTLGRLGYGVVLARNGEEAITRLRRGDIHLVITDWEMPAMNGLELCKAVRREDLSGYVYVIMLTGRTGTRSRIEGLDAGADDFLNKPLDQDELVACLKRAERMLSLETRDVALFALAKMAESRDPETGAHVERVQSYTRLIAGHIAPQVKTRHGINEEYIRLLYQTSALHDLGKVSIPDSVLLKPGKLTAAEYTIMKTHTLLGAHTLDAALRRFPQAGFLQMARDIAANHHEKFDGTGYPGALAAEQIPMCARIVGLADVYDALTSRRVYKEAMPHDQAKGIILRDRGGHFDPDIVDAFLLAEPQILAVRERLKDDSALIAPQSEPAGDPVAPSREFAQRGILIVEDDDTMRQKLVELLSMTEEPIFSAANVTEAKVIVEEQYPRLVVSDWEMPGGDGLELCRFIRQQPGCESVYFIMLTIHSDQGFLISAYKAGVSDFVAKPFHPAELQARVQAGLRIVAMHEDLALKTKNLQAMNAQLAAVNTRLDRLSATDELTGLFNRRHAMLRLDELWALADRYVRPLTVAMIDIDHFKQINDQYGHVGGDAILRAVATVLRDQTRGSDAVCRIGGEEFLIIFPAQTLQEALICAERCRAAVAQNRYAVGGVEIPVTVSIGLATRTSGTAHFPDLLKLADEALYAAKSAGRNQVKTEEHVHEIRAALALKSAELAAVPPTAADPIDMKQVRERCGNDDKFTLTVIAKFRANAGAELQHLTEGLARRDADAVKRAGHNLKSMSSYISAHGVIELSGQIEDFARSNELAPIEALANSLRGEINMVNQWLAHHIEPKKIAS